MKTYYEIKHCGRTKRFDRLDEAAKHGDALSKLGYKVTLNMVTVSAYSTIVTQIYKI